MSDALTNGLHAANPYANMLGGLHNHYGNVRSCQQDAAFWRSIQATTVPSLGLGALVAPAPPMPDWLPFWQRRHFQKKRADPILRRCAFWRMMLRSPWPDIAIVMLNRERKRLKKLRASW